MGRMIIYYEIEKHEMYEDSDERADSDLVGVKTWWYYFDDEPFIHPLHSIQFDPDRPYELLVESLLALRRQDPSKKKVISPQESGPSRRSSPTPQYSPLGPVIRLGSPSSPTKMVPPTQGQEGVRQLKSWELILPSEGWMCDGDNIEGGKASEELPDKVDVAKGIEKEDKNEEEEEGGGEEEEDPEEDPSEEEMPAIPCAMDVDADENYLQYLGELRHHPEYFPIHSSQAFAQHPSDDAQSPSSDAHSQPSYDFSGIWPPPVGPSQ
ncbi:hypothetical protein PIB30_056370 [Stylosanthes scabra]|uniref:Uncharacterized protein n=1 Tax=Stylosanthes scabra TaxID=79078 RepID=A0ABU6SKL0_9FABA|nr:hypothetical protein [Stylosanthes scabra]